MSEHIIWIHTKYVLTLIITLKFMNHRGLFSILSLVWSSYTLSLEKCSHLYIFHIFLTCITTYSFTHMYI